MATKEERGEALWLAVLDAEKRWHQSDDVMGVGRAGDVVVVLRAHVVARDVFTEERDNVRRIG